jgi:nitroimidazol reductase NimA-like FMN-containing flavoprotein (pyridoxamine 5'-phosphate oxidase superfamily)
MKITGAMGSAYSMTEEEVDKFLESKLNLQLATIDELGDPGIQPVWFEYDKDKKSLFIMTPKTSKKAQNIRRKSKIYFSIDDENFPYKGVKGKGEAKVLEDEQKIMLLVEKINMKYLGTLDHPIAKMLIDNTRNGIETVFEITPKFFSTWDFGKA